MIDENSPIYLVAMQSKFVRKLTLDNGNLILHTNKTFDGYDLIDLVLGQDGDNYILTELGEYVEQYELDEIEMALENTHLYYDGQCIYCYVDQKSILDGINEFMELVDTLNGSSK